MTTKIDLTTDIIKAIATRKALGTSVRELSKEFGYSNVVINRALSTEIAKAIQKEIVESAVTGAVAVVRRELADLVPLTLQAVRAQLEDNSLEAVKIVYRALGMEQQEEKQGNATQAIQVILPGAQAPIKDVANEIQEG